MPPNSGFMQRAKEPIVEDRKNTQTNKRKRKQFKEQEKRKKQKANVENRKNNPLKIKSNVLEWIQTFYVNSSFSSLNKKQLLKILNVLLIL